MHEDFMKEKHDLIANNLHTLYYVLCKDSKVVLYAFL